ncbi:cysteine desulfurase family protein [Spiribacter vilamensis]|uniref:Cysteine desulfurase n=1 Tax=Spiribacter vilamensis TaxID=531306 RepID=A0A4Q8D0P8_9GAMM|nr:cysteine desulfurase family protein [Spiribacter vilamensis]RZU98899.1 cysteine desulfurase [Spiribacter vilamensis]TVO62087.1 cysteine desulfurase [Spiribacter vilamensis]
MTQPYLDYAATTPVDPRVSALMASLEGPDGVFANPSSAHPAGQAAAARVEAAEAQVCETLGDAAFRTVWTSGATEADNLAILGMSRALAKRGEPRRRILVTATEHSAVLAAAQAAREYGMQVETLPVAADGRLAPETLVAALDTDVALVSLALVNNETGVVQDIPTLAGPIHEVGARLHLDAAQALGRLADTSAYGYADLVSLSAHKCCGPKGIGALCYRPDVRLSPLLHGGGQQAGLRSGTLPVPLIAGMGEALRLVDDAAERCRQYALQRRMRQALHDLGGVVVNGGDDRAPHILNVSFPGVHGGALRAALSDLSVGFGSACSRRDGPSHVLRAMGRPDALAYASVRLSLGRFTTEEEIDRAMAAVTHAVGMLRSISPLWRDIGEGRHTVHSAYGFTTALEMA